MTLTELQTKREEILASIGIARVQFGERSVQYADQQMALAAIDAEIAKLNQADQPRVFVVQSSRGLD